MGGGAYIGVDGREKGTFSRDAGRRLTVKGCQGKGGNEKEGGLHRVKIRLLG
jgi:hypothetical protein